MRPYENFCINAEHVSLLLQETIPAEGAADRGNTKGKPGFRQYKARGL